MESTFKIKIPGPPQAWTRPRFDRKGRRVFNTSRLDRWYDLAAATIAPAWGLTPPLSGPLALEVHAITPRPQSIPAALKRLGWTAAKYRAHTGRIPRATTPDLDNLIKAAADALQGGKDRKGSPRPAVINDDSLIVKITAAKWYAAAGEAPGVELELWEVEI